MDPDSPIHTLNYLLLGITQDKAALKCDELLKDVEELNKEMKESTDYLSNMMNDLEEQAAKNALTDYINSMNNASGELTTTLWLEYETYLENAAEYAENPTQTNYNNLESAGNILFDHMEKMYDEHQLTTMIDNYIGYASPYKPHVDPDDKKAQSDKQSYMDLLYEVCGTQYLFDHQKHAVLTSAVNERIGTLNQMIELEYAKMFKRKAKKQGVLLILCGLLSLVAGFFAVGHPIMTMISVGYIIAFDLMIQGGTIIVAACMMKKNE